MGFKYFILVAVIYGVGAAKNPPKELNHKLISNLRSTLEQIRSDLLSMKPSMEAVAGVIDNYNTQPVERSAISVDDAYELMKANKMPPKCFQEASMQLETLRNYQSSNCSSLNIIEDIGSLVYNSANFTSLSMMYIDDFLTGLERCGEWYYFWNYIPCVFKYAFNSFVDVKDIIYEASLTFSDNERLIFNIVDQVTCHTQQFSAVVPTTVQILNQADVCAKN